MIVEFAGSSCSGKSTLIRSLSRALEERQVPFRLANAWSTSRRDVVRAIRCPGIVAWSALNPGLVFSNSGRQFLGAVGYSLRLRGEARLVLLDEGPVKLHKRSVLRSSRAAQLLQRGLPAPDLLVLVTCDPAERLDRLRKTKRPHALNRSDDYLLTDQSGRDMAERFATKRKVPVARVDTTGGADGVPQLWPVLEQLMS